MLNWSYFWGRLCSFSILKVLKACAIDIDSGMHRTKLRDLRAAIYQMKADTDKIKKIKADMEKHLEAAEEKP